MTDLLNDNAERNFDSSKYCLKMVVDDSVTRSCGVPYLLQQANATGALVRMVNSTCTDTGIATFCLCTKDKCNMENSLRGPSFILGVILFFFFLNTI